VSQLKDRPLSLDTVLATLGVVTTTSLLSIPILSGHLHIVGRRR